MKMTEVITLSKENDKNVQANKGDDTMNATIDTTRPCTISESIIQSCQEVNMMREGKTPKYSLDDVFSNIKKRREEEEE